MYQRLWSWKWPSALQQSSDQQQQDCFWKVNTNGSCENVKRNKSDFSQMASCPIYAVYAKGENKTALLNAHSLVPSVSNSFWNLLHKPWRFPFLEVSKAAKRHWSQQCKRNLTLLQQNKNYPVLGLLPALLFLSLLRGIREGWIVTTSRTRTLQPNARNSQVAPFKGGLKGRLM